MGKNICMEDHTFTATTWPTREVRRDTTLWYPTRENTQRPSKRSSASTDRELKPRRDSPRKKPWPKEALPYYRTPGLRRSEFERVMLWRRTLTPTGLGWKNPTDGRNRYQLPISEEEKRSYQNQRENLAHQLLTAQECQDSKQQDSKQQECPSGRTPRADIPRSGIPDLLPEFRDGQDPERPGKNPGAEDWLTQLHLKRSDNRSRTHGKRKGDPGAEKPGAGTKRPPLRQANPGSVEPPVQNKQKDAGRTSSQPAAGNGSATSAGAPRHNTPHINQINQTG